MKSTAIPRMVRWARRRAGMTQAQLAQAVNMPQPSIARIENGTVSPRSDTLLAILAATGHDLSVEPRAEATATVDEAAVLKRLGMDVRTRTWRALGTRITRDRRSGPFHVVRRLRLAAVPFVVVGELAEVAHGAPIELDGTIEVCHATTDEARRRLEVALQDLATTPAAARRLRLLTATAAGDDFDTLDRNATRMFIDAGIQARVASLDDLIRARLASGRPEDRAAVSVLRFIGEVKDSFVGPMPADVRRA